MMAVEMTVPTLLLLMTLVMFILRDIVKVQKQV